MKLICTEEHRYYHVDDEGRKVREFDGTTTIIQLEGGMPGIEFCSPRAAERGRMAHLATALFDLDNLDEEVPLDDEIKGYFESWKRFREAQTIQYAPQQVEVMMCDEVYGFAGTLDRLPLLDIKTGVYKKADLAQLGAYYGLCQANKIDRDLYMGPEARKVVYLNEDGSFPMVDQYSVREVMAARDSFLMALGWNRFKNSK
jgi:hypothetical protein